MDDEPAVEHERKIFHIPATPPARIKYAAKHEGVQSQHQEWINNSPQKTEHRATIPRFDISDDERAKQATVFVEAKDAGGYARAIQMNSFPSAIFFLNTARLNKLNALGPAFVNKLNLLFIILIKTKHKLLFKTINHIVL